MRQVIIGVEGGMYVTTPRETWLGVAGCQSVGHRRPFPILLCSPHLACIGSPLYTPQPPQSPAEGQPEHREDPAAADEGGYLHYCQNQLSPRSRHDYDAFNRAHFERLHSAQGRASKRAVTPKVPRGCAVKIGWCAFFFPGNSMLVWQRSACL